MANKETMKTKDNLLTLLGWFFAIVGISLILLGMIQASSHKPITKKVNCYDEYGSKILNQTYEKTYNFSKEANGYFFLSMFPFVGGIISFGLRSFII